MVKDESSINKEILEFYGKIKNLYPVKKVLLYGSYAKGNNRADSDIDIAVVIDEEDYFRKFDITAQLLKSASEVDVLLEPKCIYWKDFLNYEPASILGEIIRTSKTIA